MTLFGRLTLDGSVQWMLIEVDQPQTSSFALLLGGYARVKGAQFHAIVLLRIRSLSK